MSAIRVARLLVPGTTLSVAVPAGVLVTGRYYYATIYARTADYIGKPHWTGADAFAGLLTNKFTP
jgi:hypothetical protein